MTKEHEGIQNVVHVEGDEAGGQDQDLTKEMADRLFAAKQSTEVEVTMSVWEALKLYPMASMWSILISFAVVMEGMEVVPGQ